MWCHVIGVEAMNGRKPLLDQILERDEGIKCLRKSEMCERELNLKSNVEMRWRIEILIVF